MVPVQRLAMGTQEEPVFQLKFKGRKKPMSQLQGHQEGQPCAPCGPSILGAGAIHFTQVAHSVGVMPRHPHGHARNNV